MKSSELIKNAEKLKNDLEVCLDIEKEYLYYKIFDDCFNGQKFSNKEKDAIIEKALALDE